MFALHFLILFHFTLAVFHFFIFVDCLRLLLLYWWSCRGPEKRTRHVTATAASKVPENGAGSNCFVPTGSTDTVRKKPLKTPFKTELVTMLTHRSIEGLFNDDC
jgi:hypothetical protein